MGSRLIAVEPNLAMHGALRRRAKATGITLDVISGGAESIPPPDESVDVKICTLVLCTMQDPHRVLAEVRRVLRPGGRFRFVEHVAAAGSGRRLVQRALRRRGRGSSKDVSWTETPTGPQRGRVRRGHPRTGPAPPLDLLPGEHRGVGHRRPMTGRDPILRRRAVVLARPRAGCQR